jgi:hypothetical protein
LLIYIADKVALVVLDSARDGIGDIGKGRGDDGIGEIAEPLSPTAGEPTAPDLCPRAARNLSLIPSPYLFSSSRSDATAAAR